MMPFEPKGFDTLNVYGVDYQFIISEISKGKASNLFKKWWLEGKKWIIINEFGTWIWGYRNRTTQVLLFQNLNQHKQM